MANQPRLHRARPGPMAGPRITGGSSACARSWIGHSTGSQLRRRARNKPGSPTVIARCQRPRRRIASFLPAIARSIRSAHKRAAAHAGTIKLERFSWKNARPHLLLRQKHYGAQDGPTAIEIRGVRPAGLLSPSLSSKPPKGGEGESSANESCEKGRFTFLGWEDRVNQSDALWK
jgi:hypothetical protein